ncbi:MAG: hypothetical protein A2428_10840 [Bdellovibrionales bacterium RIFOXYC1_FULL_54_43]|nr:MAG: hypothetical protein A2428_10840 [Bdellovibrionales bacterium RIFOXYC1_FULL_54_43]OFZ78371.1 MAG: hypothetical protein A2603_12610 [Bdellovibrionales bacterium RIFOXYD1_FULL_55_31]
MTLSKECSRKVGLITTLLIALHLGFAPALRSDAQPALTIQTAADGTQTAVVNGKTVGTIEILKAGTRLYHWAHPRDIERWARAGRVPGEEVAALMKNHDNMMAGGGFYVSKNALDSSHFGEKLLIIEVKKDTRILNANAADLNAILGNDWGTVQRELRVLDLSGMRYSSTWLNFFKESPLENAWTPKNSTEILDAFQRDSPDFRPPSFQQLLRLDQSYPLVDHPVIQEIFPELSKFLAGKPLTEPEQIKLYAHLSTMPEVHSSITKKLRQLFHSRFVQEYKRSFVTITKNGRINPEVDFEFVLESALKSGVQAKEILPGIQHEVAPIMTGFLPYKPKLTNDFARNFYESFEFIDWNDIVDSMEKGDPAPWTRYDQTGMAPLLDRWRKAKQPVGGTDPDSEVLGSYRALSGNPNGTYRDAPIIAGGDFEVNGKKYYRITESQLETLKKDLFLSVEWVDDPNPPQGAPTKTYLARHEYPSARTYKKFEQLLSADLLKKLKQAHASGQLANEASIEFKNLTQAVLKELILYSEKENVSPLFRYQLQISIHPFSDYNGRSLRAKYFKDANQPLVMKNWDLDLFLNYEEFASESAAGRLQYQALFKGLFDAEKASPDAPPKFYDVKEPYMMVSGVSELDEPPADFVNRVKAFYADPANDELIRRKQYYDVELGLKKQCVRQALFNQFGI